jgi:hypothetical protein
MYEGLGPEFDTAVKAWNNCVSGTIVVKGKPVCPLYGTVIDA